MTYVPPGVTADQLQTFADRLQQALQTLPKPTLSQVKEAFARAAGYAHAHEAQQATHAPDRATGKFQGLPLWPSVSCLRLHEWAAPFRRLWCAQTTPSALAVLAHQWGHVHVKTLVNATKSERPPTLRSWMKGKGYTAAHITTIQRLLHQPVGLLCVATRDGSNGQELLRQLFNAIQQYRSKIYTLADPPEYNNFRSPPSPLYQEKIAEAIKVSMRADPDVLMTGEIRDEWSAQGAQQACQAGIQVLSSVKASSAWHAVACLRGFGLTPQQVAHPEFLTGVIYQETFPCLCSRCAVPYEDPQSQSRVERRVIRVLKKLALSFTQVKTQGLGCRHCDQTGFRGETVCVDLLSMKDLRHSWTVASRPPSSKASSTENAFRSQVFNKIASGLISPWQAVSHLLAEEQENVTIIDIGPAPYEIQDLPGPKGSAEQRSSLSLNPLDLRLEAPTGQPPFIWSAAQKEELMGAFREIAAIEARIKLNAPDQPASGDRKKGARPR